MVRRFWRKRRAKRVFGVEGMKMNRPAIFLMLCGLFLQGANAQNQKKEYITFSDTKGQVIACRGGGLGGDSDERYFVKLTIKYPTLPAYQKQYSKHYLVLDPDPPKNLTLEQGGYKGPCSNYYLNPLPVETKKIHDPSDSYPKAPSLQSAMILINAWIEYTNQAKPITKWVNGFKVTAGFSLPYCSESNSLSVAHAVFDDERQSAFYNSFNDTSLHTIKCKPDDKSDYFDAIPYGFNKNESVELPSERPNFSREQVRKIKFFMHDYCLDIAFRYIIVNGKEYIYRRMPLTSCKTNGKTLEIDLSNEKYPSYK